MKGRLIVQKRPFLELRVKDALRHDVVCSYPDGILPPGYRTESEICPFGPLVCDVRIRRTWHEFCQRCIHDCVIVFCSVPLIGTKWSDEIPNFTRHYENPAGFHKWQYE